MKVSDADRYRITEANRDLYLVYLGSEMVGSVRRGIDMKWYPELLPESFKNSAAHKVMIAHQAVAQFLADVDGNR